MNLNVPVACAVSTSPEAHDETTAGSANNSEENAACNDIGLNSDQNGSSAQVVISPMLQYHYVPILATLKNYLQQPDV